MTDFSYQLYSSRNFQPLEATLTMVAKAGYTAVEGYGNGRRLEVNEVKRVGPT